ncbi:tRNA lysidine(34) synthetase TilS [Chloroflexota bacterium]
MAKDDLLKQIAGATRRCIPDGGPLVVAVSGGGDSVCLLHALAQLKDKLNLKLHVAHLNHSLRGAESDADAQYVADLAGKLNISVTIEKRDISTYGNTSSVEDKARNARYTFLAEVAASVGANAVAVAHTADDQVETILMHLVRGTGLAGLCGMREVSTWKSTLDESDVTIIRPLLGVTRKGVEAYCTASGLAPRIDSSNKSPGYMRNRFRHELIPQLMSYNANFKDALLRLAYVVADEIVFMDEQVSGVWNTVVSEENKLININRDVFGNLPVAGKRHLMRRVLEHLAGTLTDIEAIHIENVLEVMEKPVGKKLSLPYGLVLVNGYDTCTIGKEGLLNDAYEVFEGEYALNVPGDITILGWKVTASIENNQVKSESKYDECFDYDVVGDQLTVRGKRAGAKFQPLGMDGSKSLKDFMVDLKIPKARRDGIPIVCSAKHIIWVVGHRIDERASVSASTKRIIRLKFDRNSIDSYNTMV